MKVKTFSRIHWSVILVNVHKKNVNLIDNKHLFRDSNSVKHLHFNIPICTVPNLWLETMTAQANIGQPSMQS
jgi:hypothetical protein